MSGALRSMQGRTFELAQALLGSRQLNHLVRFAPVLELVLQAPGQHRTILDVGSGSQGIAALLPRAWTTTAVDANFDDYHVPSDDRRLQAHQRIGDVRELPFPEQAFDVVIAVDLLEHVDPGDRDQAVSEICRVSAHRAVIAFPGGEPALAGDQRLAAWFTDRGRAVPGWLQEHLDNGLPEPNQVAATASRYGTVRVLGNESIKAHERLVTAENRPVPAGLLRLVSRLSESLLTSRHARVRQQAHRLLSRVAGSHIAPTYRTIIVIDR